MTASIASEVAAVLYGDLGPHGTDPVAGAFEDKIYTVRILTREPVVFSSGLRREPVINRLLIGTTISVLDEQLILDVDLKADPSWAYASASPIALIREQFRGACERSSVEAVIARIFEKPSEPDSCA